MDHDTVMARVHVEFVLWCATMMLRAVAARPSARHQPFLAGRTGSSSQASCSLRHSSMVLPRCARERITETRRAATCSPVSVSLTPAREVRGTLTLKLGASAVRLMRRTRRSLSHLLSKSESKTNERSHALGLKYCLCLHQEQLITFSD